MRVGISRCGAGTPGKVCGALRVHTFGTKFTTRNEAPSMTADLPDSALELRSLVTSQGTLELSLHDVPVPTPAANEVLVRVEASPINPSDLGLLIAGADMTTATVAGTPERPIVTASVGEASLGAVSARLAKSLPGGNEGAGPGVGAGAP